MFDLLPFDRRQKSLARYFDDMERSFWNEMPNALAEFKTDILDKGDHYLLQAELPGFEKGEIQIDLDGDSLVIHAEHNAEKEEKDDQYIRRERRYGSYARRFDVSSIRTGDISASYQNGVLELKLPKKQPEAPVSKKIEVQ
jgi:HSP20 family protein